MLCWPRFYTTRLTAQCVMFGIFFFGACPHFRVFSHLLSNMLNFPSLEEEPPSAAAAALYPSHHAFLRPARISRPRDSIFRPSPPPPFSPYSSSVPSRPKTNSPLPRFRPAQIAPSPPLLDPRTLFRRAWNVNTRRRRRPTVCPPRPARFYLSSLTKPSAIACAFFFGSALG